MGTSAERRTTAAPPSAAARPPQWRTRADEQSCRPAGALRPGGALELAEVVPAVDHRHSCNRHSLSAETRAPRHPGWTDFGATRDELDPGRTFSKWYTARALGP